ncbi:very short patch repair endonuclease [Streptomyces sp. NBC_01267]|uniref:very short patch repair endonuclease n=1 Tax=unclassified Streptomyces TaxID=2593676 RepID=UPI002E3614E5|nr:very short patch repair endonuclease [Streptomyces sp. NBC_01267]
MSTVEPSSPDVSERMRRQPRRDTRQEKAVRKLLHASGHRYRVAWKIPDMPRRSVDIAFTRAHVAVFLDGCFWHGCPEHATQPKSNAEWWKEKLAKNMARDRDTTERLTESGWTVLRFWEHESPARVAEQVADIVDRERSGRQS